MTPELMIRTALTGVLAAATLSLAACGGSASGSPAVSSSSAVSSASAAGQGDCGGDVVDAVKKAVTSPAVRKIQVIGGCTEVSIETNLGPDAKPDGAQICDAAARVAYSGSVGAVSVDGADGHELAAGIKGRPCI